MAWKKGQSGNPGGRPKEVAEVLRLAAKAAPDAIKQLIELSKTSPDIKTRVAALIHILDRACGKPAQAVEHSGKVELPITFVIGTKQITPKIADGK